MVYLDRDHIQRKRKPSYQQRKDLTSDEIMAINHYKDLVNPQYQWDYKPPVLMCKNVGVDCCMVNNILRGNISYDSLTKGDKIQFSQIVDLLSSAILKSRVRSETLVMKGLGDASWIEKYQVNGIFYDEAFGSYTTSKNVANKYARINKDGKKVFIYHTLEAGSAALFVDNDESEYILPKGRKYQITQIGYFRHATVYYLKSV